MYIRKHSCGTGRQRKPRKYKTNPYYDRLARPRLGLITYKFNNIDPYDIMYGCPCARMLPGCCYSGRCRRRRLRRVSFRIAELAVPLPRKRTVKYRGTRAYRVSRACCGSPLLESRDRGDSGFSFERTPQLACPYVRKLLDTKQLFRRCCYTHERLGIMDRSIEESFYTVYSRLAKVQMPRKRKPRYKWTEADWARHRKWLAKNALPKDLDRYMLAYDPRWYFCLKQSQYKINLEHLEKLARPKHITEAYQPPNPPKCSDVLQPQLERALHYVMTAHMKKLATPHEPKLPPDEFEFGTFEPEFPPPARYAAMKSKGVVALAEPRTRRKRFQKGDNASVVFEVSKAAKNAKPSENLIKMSKPITRENTGVKANPFSVSKKALSKKPMDKKKQEFYNRMSTPLRITEKFVKK